MKRRVRSINTPDTCQIAIKINIWGKVALMYFFYWQLLQILFADERAIKYGITPALCETGKRKFISGAVYFSAAQSWLSYPVMVLVSHTMH